MTGHPAIRNESSPTANRSPPTATPDTQSPPSEESVRRSLRALANGDASRTVDTTDTASHTVDTADTVSHSNETENSPGPGLAEATVQPREQALRVIDDAERAVSCACDAAAFLAEGRLVDLDDAIATAARDGASDAAARGRSARATLQRLDAALDGAGATGEQACAPTGTSVDGGSSP